MKHPPIITAAPLLHLHGAGCIDLLEQMYGELLLPPASEAKLAEMRRDGTTAPDPSKLPFLRPADIRASDPSRELAQALFIAGGLTEHQPPPLIILEPRPRRRAAIAKGARVSGTIGILLMARHIGLIPSIEPYLPRLAEAGLKLSPRVTTGVLLLARNL